MIQNNQAGVHHALRMGQSCNILINQQADNMIGMQWIFCALFIFTPKYYQILFYRLSTNSQLQYNTSIMI